MKPIAINEYLTAKQVSKATGATLRQLQWWDEKRLLSPKKKGHRRLYSPVEVQVAKRLTQIGGSCHGKNLRNALKHDWHKVLVITEPIVIGGTLVIPH